MSLKLTKSGQTNQLQQQKNLHQTQPQQQHDYYKNQKHYSGSYPGSSSYKNDNKQQQIPKIIRKKNINLLFGNEVGYPDATKLEDFLQNDSFLKNLKVRFLNKKIYTCIESTVIAINPFETLPLYSDEVIAAYEHHNLLSLPPHIYALCEFVLHCLKERNTDQCIICSGVSGSGKTESFKLALNYFINGSSERSELNQIKTRFNSIPTVLEAFGNANTENNSNSTRLFYTLEIDFDFLGDPLGGQIGDYFIEKTRVSKHEIYGYNFHIFYQLVGGSGSNLLKFLKLKRNIEGYYLLKDRPSDQYVSNGQHYLKEFQKTKSTMQVLGFTANEIIECFQILAFILKLGNVQFLRKANIDSTEGCTVFNDYEIYEICDMFNLDPGKFLQSFTQKVVKNQNEIFITELSADSATKIRITLCKALYFRLFTWIIEKINESIKTKPSLNLTRNNLSLYDFFGFENYYINFFEQLLVNYLHEKIIQIFVDTNFRQKQEEYIREEIGWTKLDLSTNDPICSIIERPQTGIFSILNQESSKSIYFREEIFMKDLNEHCADDLHFIQIANPVHLDNDGNGYFLHSLPFRRRVSAGDVSQSVPQLCFGIRHFNENVVYSVNGFIEKNTEHLNRNWSQFLFKSGNSMLQKLFPEGNPSKKSLRKPITLANQFTIAIESMIAKLQNKEIHFIMCIKPNRLKIPNIFDDEYVYKQLSSQFLIEHGEFLRRGYVYSEKYSTFFKRFRILTRQTWPYWNGSIVKGVCTCLQHALKTNLSDFNFGKTKILIKHMRTFIELEELRIIKLDEIAIIIQRNLRKWLQLRKYNRFVNSQIKISRCYRNWKRRMYLIWLRKHLPSPSPINHEWPPAPRSMRQTSELLRKLYHKWRCHRYRRCFDQINRNRMREKVTAMMLFKNKKASYKYSVAHPFRGDYIRLRQNVKWKRLLPTLGDVYVVFADLVSKITKRCGKEQFIQKVVVITTTSFIVLDGKTMQINQNIRLNSIIKLSCSPYMDNILVVHILTEQQQQQQQGLNTTNTNNTRAFIFESVHLIELMTKLYLVIQNNVGKGPIVEISPEFPIYTGKETLVLVFKNRNQVQQLQQQQHQQGSTSLSTSSSSQVKINRKSNRMEFSI